MRISADDDVLARMRAMHPQTPRLSPRLSQQSDSFSAISAYKTVFSAICGVAPQRPLSGVSNGALITTVPFIPSSLWGQVRVPRQQSNVPRQQSKRVLKRAVQKVSCEECFFQVNLLCALEVSEPCATFRPNEAQLRPPQQLRFVFRQERRSRAAWAFPSAQEQAALHA